MKSVSGFSLWLPVLCSFQIINGFDYIREDETSFEAYLKASDLISSKFYYKDDPELWKNIPLLLKNDYITEFCFTGM
jgi:hypothetical protein